MNTPRFIQLHHEAADEARSELIKGLTADPAHGGAQVSPKFLYDALGSRLFEAITELPEYYPTRTEASILARFGNAIEVSLPRGATLIDLGAGNCAKAASLFSRLSPARYVAVDISVDFLRASLESLQCQFPTMEMLGVGLDFADVLTLPIQAGDAKAAPRILFYPGSSIGNFTPVQALAFLKQVQTACGPLAGSGLLIGVDLVKSAVTLEAAYDDALGVTAAFNRNLITNVNRLLGSDLRLADWEHLALFNQVLSRIEMHLVARHDVAMQWPSGNRSFKKGERIHTENSYKWTIDAFTRLLLEAGFAVPKVWTDTFNSKDAGFAVMWAPTKTV